MALRRKKTKQHRAHQPVVHHQDEQPQDVYQVASHAVEQDEWPEYAERKANKKLILIIVAIIIVLAIAGGAYALIKNHKSKPVAKTTNSSQQNQPAPAANSQSASGTTKYMASGSDLNLSFNYPSDWTATPPSGTDSNDKTITVSSPSTTIMSADNQSVTGKVVVTIRPGTATISELNSSSPTAAQSSAQYAYTAPAADQHQYFYLTFIHFSGGSTASGAFEEVMVTGITSFTKGQSVSTDSLSSLDPIIAANFYKCSNTACTGTGSGVLSITNDTWTNSSLFQSVQTLFQSLKLN